MDLRYWYEAWSGWLLSWAKHYYVPDLQWWRWSDNSGWYAMREQLVEDERKLGVEKARKSNLEYLCQRLDAEADSLDEMIPPERENDE